MLSFLYVHEFVTRSRYLAKPRRRSAASCKMLKAGNTAHESRSENIGHCRILIIDITILVLWNGDQ